jgi:hypothetical protein
MSTRRDRYAIVITLTIIAGISSLGAVKAGTPGDACSLLTAPQVSSALGATVGPGQQECRLAGSFRKDPRVGAKGSRG